MRSLRIQERTVYYATNSETVTDEWGNETKGYGEPIAITVSVGYPVGSANNNGFGKSFDYDLELVSHDMECPIDEYSHLWVDVDTESDYDYIVKRKLPTMNCVRYGCMRVNVNANK